MKKTIPFYPVRNIAPLLCGMVNHLRIIPAGFNPLRMRDSAASAPLKFLTGFTPCLVIINKNGSLFKWLNCYKNFILPVMLFWRYIKRHGNKISELVLGNSPLYPVNLDRVV